jgi:hypothetical protein
MPERNDITIYQQGGIAMHEHHAEYEDEDECVECGALFCPDTRTTVDLSENGEHYWHADGSTCFLHPLTLEQMHAAGYRIINA